MTKVFSDYKELLQGRSNYYDDFQRLYKKLEASNAYYRGDVIPFLYHPFFFEQQEWEKLEGVVETLNQIINKVINKYLNDEEFRKAFGFSKQLEELILVEPGYSCPLPMARFDIFYYEPGRIKFCEFNTDGSSGMAKTNILERFFLQSRGVERLQTDYKYKLSYPELINSWIDELLNNYYEFVGRRDPHIVILDFEDSGMRGEFLEFKQTMQQRGLAVKIADPRQLEYRQNELYYDDFRIDLIYRRAVTRDLMNYYDEIDDLLLAYKDHAVCVVGPFKSHIIHDKILFAILRDEEKTDFLTDTERRFINHTIPYTVEVNPEDEKQLDYLLENKDNLVLKPKDNYGSAGVMIGQDISSSKWKKKVDNVDNSYLAQEFLELPKKELAVFNQKGKLTFQPYKFILGLFSYQQNLQGIYTRADQKNVIASSTGCVTLPNFIVKR